MTRKELQEKINSYVKKQVREQQSGAIVGVGMGHTGPKPKKEQKIYQKPPKSGKGVPSVFTKGADDISAYTKLGYREVKPSEMIDAAYLWAGKGGLKEGTQDSYDKIIDLIRNESKRLNDNEVFALHEKLKKFFNKLI